MAPRRIIQAEIEALFKWKVKSNPSLTADEEALSNQPSAKTFSPRREENVGLPRINADERGCAKSKNSPLINTDDTDQEEQDRVIARDRVIGKAKAYR